MKRHMLKFAKLSDDFGCPRSSYDNTHLEVHEDARQSQRKADRQAQSAKAHALSEMENRAKAARFEREMRMKQASTTSFTTPKTDSKAVADESLAKVMGVGVRAPTCRSSQICQQPSGINKGNAKCNYYRGYSRASVAGLDSPTIARAFILAYVIAQKVVQNSGANDFMQKGGLHADVRQDFIDIRCCTT